MKMYIELLIYKIYHSKQPQAEIYLFAYLRVLRVRGGGGLMLDAHIWYEGWESTSYLGRYLHCHIHRIPNQSNQISYMLIEWSHAECSIEYRHLP